MCDAARLVIPKSSSAKGKREKRQKSFLIRKSVYN